MSRIDEIFKIKEELDKEIALIRSICKHETYYIAMFSWRIGSSYLTKVCTECHDNSGFPNDQEIEDYESEMEALTILNQPTGKGSKIYNNE